MPCVGSVISTVPRDDPGHERIKDSDRDDKWELKCNKKSI